MWSEFFKKATYFRVDLSSVPDKEAHALTLGFSRCSGGYLGDGVVRCSTASHSANLKALCDSESLSVEEMPVAPIDGDAFALVHLAIQRVGA